MTSTTGKITLDDILVSIRELTESQKETDRQIKGLGKSQAETDRQLKETDRQLKETDRQLKETDRQLKRTDAHFNTQWGRLVESLVEGDLVKKFNERGIPVQRTVSNAKATVNQQEYEFDIIAINGDQVIVVEIKTTLRAKDVDYFTIKLNNFKNFFPEYKDKKIHGAVAYIRSDSGVVRYSEKNGLFVIRATGNSSSIINAENFSPASF